MCHPVNPEDENSAVSLRKKRETDNSNPLSMLRRHYLSRMSQKSHMLPRKSRDFNQRKSSPTLLAQSSNNHIHEKDAPSTHKMHCKMSPEQVCEKKTSKSKNCRKKDDEKILQKTEKRFIL